MSELKNFFEQIAGPLPDWSIFDRHISEKSMRQGEYIFRQGESCKKIFFVTQGLIKLFYLSPEGKEKIKSFLSEKSLFANLSSLNNTSTCTFSALALEDCRLYMFDFTAMENMQKENSAWWKLTSRLFQDLALKKERREFSFLALSPEERYQEFINENAGLVGRIDQADIARYIGITPVALSRIRGKRRINQNK